MPEAGGAVSHPDWTAMTKLKVAAAQIECRPGDVPANLARHREAIAEARSRGADVLVFPELSLTDYLAAPDLLGLARPAAAPDLVRLAEEAGPMAVSVGFIEEAPGALFFIAQALLQDGRVRHVHRKANLATYGRLEDGKHFGRGAGVGIVDLASPWRAATLICADAWNPALPWLVGLQGASLLLVPVASSTDAVADDFDNGAGWDVNLRHTALTYGLPTVMANHCGRRGGFRFWGGSRILDAFGRELARAGEEPAVIVAELAFADVRTARSRLPTIRDADPRLVRAELDRILRETAP